MVKPAPRRPKVPPKWRNRIIGYEEVPASTLLANPNNPRVHPEEQQTAMKAILDDVGWIGSLIVNKPTGRIVDGHMRADIAEDSAVPVLWVDLTDEEEREAVAFMDPIGAMATYDTDTMGKLLDGLETSVDMEAVVGRLLAPDEPADDGEKPEVVKLAPLERAHVVLSIPLDVWPEVAELLDKVEEIAGVEIHTTVK